MTIFPFQINQVMHLYGKAAGQKSRALPGKEEVAPRDVVSISGEARERQMLEQTRTGALQQVRNK